MRSSAFRHITFRPLIKSKNMMMLTLQKVLKALILSKRETQQTINLYAVASTKFQIAVQLTPDLCISMRDNQV